MWSFLASHPHITPWMQFRSCIGLVLPLLHPLLMQPDPAARMGVWYENRVGKVSYE